jgi:hypothetical protein
MTDIDKFHEWVESQSPLALREYIHAQAAWQARGELDAVHIKEWQSLTKEEFVAIAKSIWGDNLGMGDGYGYTVACASSYATIEPSSKMLLLLKKIDEALREKNNE